MGFNREAALREITRLEEQQSRTKHRLNVLMVRVQKHCPHPVEQVREGQYIKHFTGGAAPPFRVCILCGYAEEGWGSGYLHLHNAVFHVAELPPDVAHRYVRRFMTRSE